jgi:hypothetical protein
VTVALGGTAALTLGAHGMHAPLAVGVGAAAAAHALVLDDLAIKVVLRLDNAAKEHPAVHAGVGALEADVPSTKRSPDDARWHLRALFRFYLTLRRHSPLRQPQRRGSLSLLTAPPGRRVVVRTGVGNWDLTSPTRVDGVDLEVLRVSVG